MVLKFVVIIGLIYNFLFFMVLFLYVSFEWFDLWLLEVVGDLYVILFIGFCKVMLLLLLFGLVVGMLLMFIFVVGDYINFKLLGSMNIMMIG